MASCRQTPGRRCRPPGTWRRRAACRRRPAGAGGTPSTARSAADRPALMFRPLSMSNNFPFRACGVAKPCWVWMAWTRDAVVDSCDFQGTEVAGSCGAGPRLCPVAVGRRGRGSFPRRSLGHCIFLIGKELCMPGTPGSQALSQGRVGLEPTNDFRRANRDVGVPV